MAQIKTTCGEILKANFGREIERVIERHIPLIVKEIEDVLINRLITTTREILDDVDIVKVGEKISITVSKEAKNA